MKKLNFLIISTFILLFSCEVEEIKPNEIPDVITPIIEEEGYTQPPCEDSLTIGKITFDNERFNGYINIDSINVNGCTNSTFSISTDLYLNNYDMYPVNVSFYFLNKPKTGKYIVQTKNYLQNDSESKIAYVNFKSGTHIYESTQNISLYVKNTNDSLYFSFCGTTFKNGNLTIPNCKGKLGVNLKE
jgi:hypothetical protein